MKIHVSYCVALAVTLIATAANGQQQRYQMQNQQQQRYQTPHQQHQAPVFSQQVSVVKSNPMQSEQPALQVQQPAENASSCGCDSGCTTNCGSTNCRNRIFGNRGQRGGGLQSMGAYDPCCPTKYVSVFGGAAIYEDIGFGLSLTPTAGPTDTLDAIIDQNEGWTIGGAIGRSIGRRFRGEVEFSYRNATFNQADLAFNGVSAGSTPLDGQLNQYRSMSNIYFDFNPNGRFNAYVGGGVGVAFIDLDAAEATTPIAARLESSSWVYQGIVGCSARVSQRADLFMDYRYFGTDHLEFTGASPIGAASANVDVTSNDIFIGIRMKR